MTEIRSFQNILDMFGVELIALPLALGAIALAYFVFNYSLREKTFEEALAEQRGGGTSESAKNSKKDKGKKPKKTVPKSAEGSVGDVSSKSAGQAACKDAPIISQFSAVNGQGKKRVDSDSTSADEASEKAARAKKPVRVAANLLQSSGSESERMEHKELLPVKSKKENDFLSDPVIKGSVFHPTHEEKKQKQISTSETSARSADSDADGVERHVVHVGKSQAEKTHLCEYPGKNTTSGDIQGQKEKKHAAEQVSTKKHHVALSELPQTGHLDAVSKLSPKKDGKSTEKPAKHVQAVGDGVVRQKDAAQKKPSTVVSTNGPAHLDSGASEYTEILGLLKNVQLTDAETQNLLQVLIVKQSERHTEWVQLGKGKSADPATIAKRLIEDKERELHEEKQLNQALKDQLKDFKDLRNQEAKHLRELSDAHRQAQDKASSLDQQLKSVTTRLKDSQDKQTIEVAHLTRRVQDAENRAANVIAVQQKTIVTDDTEGVVKELKAVRAERDNLKQELGAQQEKIRQLERNPFLAETETHVRSADADDSTAALQAIQYQLVEARQKEELSAQSCDALEKKLASLSSSLAKRESEVENLGRQLEEAQSSHAELKHYNDTLLNSLESLQHEKASSEAESRLHDEVEQLKASLEKQNEELENQFKLVQSEGFDEAKKYYEPQITETRDRHREVISRLFPLIHLDQSLNSAEWLQALEEAARNTAQKNDSLSSRSEETVQQLSRQLSDLQIEQTALQGEVEKYRVTLAQTEEKLRLLEASVETEEEKWEVVGQSAKDHESKCRDLETQLSQVQDQKKSVERLLEERSSLVNATEHRLQAAEERLKAFASVQEQLDSLQHEADRLKGDLGETRRDKDHFSQESQQLRQDLAHTQRDKTEAEQRAVGLQSELIELKNKSDNLIVLHREALDLKQALEVEKDNAKKMAQELLRSRSLIQVGLESLRKEEETVSKLKEALEVREHGLNGSFSGDRAGSSGHVAADHDPTQQVSLVQ
ncbi:hypothetical protein BV898_02517 [Hypsibius exemplaris]|uniref:Ribosome receptor lysine/proline rich domain-containing protein n=1 Tax=Hypsibius exemplaris TaxID=2072580 RepID=A0A1W0X906_HYPEX|nr:hypothetical protein BV898_02517 [Hypsibius exemplaris]